MGLYIKIIFTLFKVERRRGKPELWKRLNKWSCLLDENKMFRFGTKIRRESKNGCEFINIIRNLSDQEILNHVLIRKHIVINF